MHMKTDRGILFLLSVVSILFCSLLIYVAVRELSPNVQLNNTGVETEGVIVEKYIDQAPRFPNYWITYQYVVDELSFTHREEVSFDYYQRAAVDDVVLLTYLEEDPTVAQLKMPFQDGVQILSFGLFLLTPLLIIGGSVLAGRWGSYLRKRRMSNERKWYDDALTVMPLLAIMALLFAGMTVFVDGNFGQLLFRTLGLLFLFLLAVILLTNLKVTKAD